MQNTDQIVALIKRAVETNQRYVSTENYTYEIVQNGKTGWHARTLAPGEKRKATINL